MVRSNILIVDEFVRTEKDIIQRVFVPFLTDVRTPRYVDLTDEERAEIPIEPNKQLYLSSIRGADEWSYHYFEEYLDYMAHGDMRYTTVSLPYQFGLKNGFINRDIVEQQFKEGQENLDMLLAGTIYRLYMATYKENPFNCLKPLKIITLQHNLRMVSVNVAKAEKSNNMIYGVSLSIFIMGNWQLRLHKCSKVQRLFLKGSKAVSVLTEEMGEHLHGV